MATASDMREWARANGYTVSVKGAIPQHVAAAYEAAHPGANGSAGTTHPDYPDDDFESAFADIPEDTGETPPKPLPKGGRSGSSAGGGSRSRSLFRNRGSKAKAAKKKQPRVSTEDLLGSVWRGLAKMATPLPPLHRTLRVQAPVAGLLLEDAVKGTMADTVLQPVARFAQQGKVVSALLGPPVLVTAISVHMQQAAAQERLPNPLFMSVSTEALRGSLMTWMEVAGPKFEIAMAREREFEDKYGKSVDDFMQWLFSAPVADQDEAAVQAEEDAIRRAQGIL